jgi:hypothetical protein
VLSNVRYTTGPIPVGYPLFYLYQIVESDEGGPTNADVANALKTGAAAGFAAYAGDYQKAASQGIQAIADMASIATKAAAKGDDLYPVMISVYDGESLYRRTATSTPGPVGKPLFESAGWYNGYAIQVDSVPGNWRLATTITRTASRPECRACSTECCGAKDPNSGCCYGSCAKASTNSWANNISLAVCRGAQ